MATYWDISFTKCCFLEGGHQATGFRYQDCSRNRTGCVASHCGTNRLESTVTWSYGPRRGWPLLGRERRGVDGAGAGGLRPLPRGLDSPAFFETLPNVEGLFGLDIGCGEGHNTR